MNPSQFPSRRAFLHSLDLSGAGTLAFGVSHLPKLPTVDQETRRATQAAPLRLVFRGETQERSPIQCERRAGPKGLVFVWNSKGFLFTTARTAATDLIRRRRGVPHEAISEIDELPLLDDTPGTGHKGAVR